MDGLNIGPPKWCACGHGLNHSVHEGMKNISNVKVCLRIHSANVNIVAMKLLQVGP